MVKRLLRRQLVDTLHTKRSERLFPLLKSSLRDDGGGAEGHCGSVVAGPRTAGWIAARSPGAGLSAKPELVWSKFPIVRPATGCERCCLDLLGCSFEANRAATLELIGRPRGRYRRRRWPEIALCRLDRSVRIF